MQLRLPLPASTDACVLPPAAVGARAAQDPGGAVLFGKVLPTLKARGWPQPGVLHPPVEKMEGMAQGSGECLQPGSRVLFRPGCWHLATLLRVPQWPLDACLLRQRKPDSLNWCSAGWTVCSLVFPTCDASQAELVTTRHQINDVILCLQADGAGPVVLHGQFSSTVGWER